MIKIGSIELGSKPNIVLAVDEFNYNLTEAYSNGVSILEIRIDQFSNTDLGFVRNQLKKFRSLRLPLMATIRPVSEKGSWEENESKREELFLQIIELVDAIDIELTSHEINRNVATACKEAGKTLIVSNHVFSNTPEISELEAQMSEAKGLGADIFKLACLAKNQEDVVRLLGFVKNNRESGVIGISMGSCGAISRLIATLFGSLLTYTSTNPCYGQLPLQELVYMSRLFYPSFNQDIIISRELMEYV
jgi:3-dehydroquinate dehydratase I